MSGIHTHKKHRQRARNKLSFEKRTLRKHDDDDGDDDDSDDETLWGRFCRQQQKQHPIKGKRNGGFAEQQQH